MGGPAPAVSVIVPVFNVARHVAGCIASLKAQSSGDFEALVIDDGSGDDSAAQAADAIAGDPRFRLIRQENRGLGAARNVGLERARGTMIAFLDGDDRLAPGFLERMRAALAESGAGWVACALRLCLPDGRTIDHPAIHNAPLPAPEVGLQRHALDDCRAIARHFPSAWNKLYRRDFIGEARFPEGSWFEDHEFFWRLALRADCLPWLPEPLYLHSRDREGQITGADDERAFEQIAVLERLRPVIEESNRAGAADGFALLARRLLLERALVLRNPERRNRFLAQARAFLARHGAALPNPPPAAPVAGPAPATTPPRPALAVAVVETGDAAALARTRAALDAQSLPGIALTLLGGAAPPADWADAGHAPASLSLQAFLDTTDSRHVALLRAGQAPSPDAFMRLVNALDLSDESMAMAGFERLAFPGDDATPSGYHDGWTDNRLAARPPAQVDFMGERQPLSPAQALRLHHCGAARVFRRALLRRIGALSLPLAHPFAGAELVLRAALAAGAVDYTPLALAQVPVHERRRALGGTAALRWAARLALTSSPGLPEGWRAVLAARMLQAEMPMLATQRARQRQLNAAWLAARLLRLGDGLPAGVDPETPAPLRQALGLAPPEGA
ncbi:MAG: glycosyltransferase family 2 protein [Pararhodobacter sp.]|nr:glycosyltransferase family 2 protein [Pararhodobacter sp.]